MLETAVAAFDICSCQQLLQQVLPRLSLLEVM